MLLFTICCLFLGVIALLICGLIIKSAMDGSSEAMVVVVVGIIILIVFAFAYCFEYSHTVLHWF